MILFENFKQFLQLAVSNAQVVKQNSVLSDANYAQAIADHISALTSDQNIRLDTTSVLSTTGCLVSDATKREVRFELKGSGKIVQGFLEANISDVRKIWQRSDDAAGTVTGTAYGTLTDNRRYYVTDADAGVFYLNEFGQIIGAVPGFGSIVGSGYGTPTSAITFEIASVEYIAIVNEEHYLQIYDTSDFSLAGTFGVPSTAGLPDAGNLDTPLDLAFDEATTTLYISCGGGGVSIPAGATSPGFVASFDLTTLPAVSFGSYVALNNGGSLHQGEVVSPVGLAYDSELESLWILNDDSSNTARPFEIGALSVTGDASDGYLKGYIEYRGSGFSVSAANKIHVDVERRRLYLTNSPGVEVFDLVTMKHLYTFGYYGVDENASNLNSPFFSPITGQVQAVGADILAVDGVQMNFALFNDATNNRLVRIGENLYEGDNTVLFDSIDFVVPVSLHGYLVKGNVPSTKIQVEYRTSSLGTWQILDQTDSVPATTYFQFRLRINAELQDVVEERYIKEIIVIGEQE